jgi:eukaryotic-like serine/threonine-protein kinase
MSNILGQQIGRYQLLDVIGQGGMGIVYRALDPEMNRPVAIKMLHGAYAEDKDLLAMFIREARSTASLEHTNIVTVFSLEESQGLPYLVMQYLEGHSIAEMIASKQPIHLGQIFGTGTFENPNTDHLFATVDPRTGFVNQIADTEIRLADIAFAPIPEPATIALVAVGFASVVLFRFCRFFRSESRRIE